MTRLIDTEAIIFDLDDTLVVTTPLYDEVRREAFAFIEAQGLIMGNAEYTLNIIEYEQIKLLGFQKERFPGSLGLLYKRLCHDQLKPFSDAARLAVEAIGYTVYTREYKLVAKVHEVLGTLRYAGYTLICMTKGDDVVQTDKLDRSGLGKYFHQVVVVPDKTVKAYEGMAKIYNLTPSKCVMIGDSIKSDVNPSRAAGFHAIHIAAPNPWHYEVEPAEYDHLTRSNLDELIDFFNARWAVAEYHTYRVAPHHNLLQGARDGVFEFRRDPALKGMMPDCPGIPMMFWRHDGEQMLEWRSVFEPDPEGINDDIPGTQWSSSGHQWVGPIDPAEYRAAKKSLPGSLCAYCKNREACAAQRIFNGRKSER